MGRNRRAPAPAYRKPMPTAEDRTNNARLAHCRNAARLAVWVWLTKEKAANDRRIPR